LTGLAITEASHASELVIFVQIEKTRHTPVAILALGMRFASADASVCFASGIVILASGFDAGARSTSEGREVVKVGQASIALRSSYARFTSASTETVALAGYRAQIVATAMNALVILGLPIVIFFAALAMWTGCISLAIEAMPSRARGSPQFLVEKASGGEVVAVARFAFVSVGASRFLPWLIVVKRQAFSAIRTCCMMFASANQFRAESLTG